MMFWLSAAALTLVAALAVLWPWLRPLPDAAAETAGDIEVYRDQLDELERDVARGVLSGEAVAEARAEIARRALKAAGGEASNRPQRSLRMIHFAAVLMVPALAWGLYAGLGSPDLPAQPLAERMSRNPAQNSIEELVARAESHLKANPDDAAGWEVIAPIYMRTGRGADAAAAFAKVITLSGATADREANLGEALLARDNGVIGADSRAAFDRALKLDARHSKARFFIALGEAQAGRFDAARSQWTALIADAGPDSPWVGASREALGQIDSLAAAPADKGPSAGDIAAANDMSAADRTAMIESMVAKLDASLRDKPDDLEGWKKLVRSYLVMGKADAAREALARAGTGLSPEHFAELKTFARDAGVTGIE